MPVSSPSPVRLLGISGSLRKASYNTALLRAAADLLPAAVTMEMADLAGLPLYDDDIRAEGMPAEVSALRARLSEADALLIATPEHNFSISAVLKNAIDWASRPPDPPLRGKPAAIMGAATGLMGTVRAQLHLRHVLVYSDVHLVNKPEVIVSRAREKFDDHGVLVDGATREILGQLVVALAEWTRRLRGF